MSSSIGKRILDLLEQKDLTQREFAEKLGITEVSVSRYINDKHVPHSDVAIKMADILETTTDYLLGRTFQKYAEQLQGLQEVRQKQLEELSRGLFANISDEEGQKIIETMEGMKKLPPEDQQLISEIVKRLGKKLGIY